MATHVDEVMTTRPRSVTREMTLAQVSEVMASEDVGAIPIVEGDRLVGLVTDRDIVVRAIARGLDPRIARVEEIASDDLITLSPDQDLSDALALMARYQVRRLPVTDANDRLIGVVSQADVAMAAKEKATGEMVEAVSTPPAGPRTVGDEGPSGGLGSDPEMTREGGFAGPEGA